MPLFRIVDGKLQLLKPNLAEKERDLQRFLEKNLEEALDVYFLKSEYATTSGGRIDTLGVDRSGAPTIIEYKRNQSANVINQALSYLKWLNAQKPEFFEMLMVRRLPKEVCNSITLDWRNPRVICIAESFNRFDVDTVEIVPIRIELINYRFYQDGVFSLEPQSVGQRQIAQGVSTQSKTDEGDQVCVPPLENLFAHASIEVQKLFADLRSLILALGPQVVERPTKSYIGYRVSKNFVEVDLQKSQIRVLLRPIDYDDPESRVTKVPKSNNWTLDRRINLKSTGELPYVMKIVEQSYADVL